MHTVLNFLQNVFLYLLITIPKQIKPFYIVLKFGLRIIYIFYFILFKNNYKRISIYIFLNIIISKNEIKIISYINYSCIILLFNLKLRKSINNYIRYICENSRRGYIYLIYNKD